MSSSRARFLFAELFSVASASGVGNHSIVTTNPSTPFYVTVANRAGLGVVTVETHGRSGNKLIHCNIREMSVTEDGSKTEPAAPVVRKKGNDDKTITLLVDGKRFSVSPSLFMRHPNTMLGRYNI